MTTESTDRELKAFADSLAEKIYGEPRLDQTDCAKLIYEALVTRPEGGGVMDGEAYVCVTTFRLVGEGNDVVLSALVDGEWFEVIREHVGVLLPISHNAEATVIINKIESRVASLLPPQEGRGE